MDNPILIGGYAKFNFDILLEISGSPDYCVEIGKLITN